MTDPINAFADHVTRTDLDDLDAAARDAVRTFVLDSVGVGIAGSTGPWLDELVAAHHHLGGDGGCRLLGRRETLPAWSAAMCNAYQIHNSEFDCVHERAVVHPMAVLLGALCAAINRDAMDGTRHDGGRFMTAVAVGVDVAAGLGVAARTALRFFRPATAGAFGATAAIGALRGFDRNTQISAFGITLAQLCGTMQAHTEGSPVLAMQVGFNARNALMACELAASGVPGPRDVLQGPYGYFPLFEGEPALEPVLAGLGRRFLITEVAHKPFPSGRATHGMLDACMTLQREHGFSAQDVAAVNARVPSLTHRLIARPVRDDMQPNYARLSGPYVCASALLRGSVDLSDFAAAALSDPARIELGRRIQVGLDDNPDPNALTPISVDITLHDGRRFEQTLDAVYGNPARPMTREAHLEKFRSNWRAAASALDDARAGELIARVDALEQETDVDALLALASA
jgi:2-methylcitrate dehydratase PrpD